MILSTRPRRRAVILGPLAVKIIRFPATLLPFADAMARVHSNLEYDLWEAHLNDGDLIKAFSTSAEFSQLTTTGDVVVAASQPVDGSSVLVDDTSRGLSRTLEVSSVTPVKKVETKRCGLLDACWMLNSSPSLESCAPCSSVFQEKNGPEEHFQSSLVHKGGQAGTFQPQY